MIFNIQRFSTHDGKGIRTLIFYKGCPLRCQWCSNPEGISYGYSILYDQRLCRNFEDCIKIEGKAIVPVKDHHGIKINREMITQPERLRDVCASKAISLSGENKSADELLTEIEKDIPFYGHNGGITLSGGEPLSQDDQLIILLRKLKNKNINVNIETSLHVAWSKVERCLGLVDVFLVDLKHIDEEKFRTYTQGDVTLVMNNLVKLTDTDAQVIIRIPVIPGFNHSEREMKEIIDFALTLPHINTVHFLPYHTFGIEKYKMLGMKYLFGSEKPVRDSELVPYIQYAQSNGLQTKIGG